MSKNAATTLKQKIDFLKEFSFEERKFIEQISSNRLGLLYKGPFLIFIAASLFFSRRVMHLRANLLPNSLYLRPHTKPLQIHNFLVVLNLGLYGINLASSLSGALICGYIYGGALKRRYLLPIPSERALINKNLDIIKKYRQFE